MVSTILAIVAFFIASNQVFLNLDNRLTDNLYSRLRNVQSDVIIIGIDEQTLNEYGPFVSWSRDKVADLINFLYADPENEPLLVAFDIVFQGEGDEQIDQKLADACKGRDVVAASIIDFKPTVDKESHEYNAYNIEMIELPYSALNNVVRSGYSNAFLSNDGLNRCSTYSFEHNGKVYNSFSYEIAKLYAEKKGIEIPEIKTDSNGLYRFFFSGKQKEFAHVSMKTVLDNKIPNTEFKNKVVFVGPYASAMQDEYFPSADISGTMYGVEINANIFQALLEGNTAVNINQKQYSLYFALFVFVICLACHFLPFVLSLIVSLAAIVGHVFLGKYLANNGLLIIQLYAIIVFSIFTIYLIIRRFLIELKRRKSITKTFSRYMDPKLVNNLAKSDSNEINLNGEKREVSVLFVDIRGFTTMSESMDPADVVGVLNEYLSHVTNCIFKHNGMLDKFIGDAAMAVFNAPVDQEDYIYESVATAYDIAKGSEEISKKLLEKYGKTVSYGVGVHCGEAVIGNIGCKTRMDYTAIGDTVNTSSRIEGKAAKGEILISKDVKEKLEGRIIVEDAGKIELKGKSEPVSVFRLIGLVDNK